MRIGIIGSGRIVRRFISEKNFVDGVVVTAIYNPHPGSAERFVGALQDEVVGIYGSAVGGLSRVQLPQPLDDIDAFWNLVDGVYIASPHETHFAYTKQALEHGKHVLCEKPLTLNEKDAKALFKLADSKKLVLMEALKTAYMPGFEKLVEVAKSGVIGDIVQVNGTFTKLVPTDSRELNGDAAGSFVELGTYGMLAVFSLLGTKFKAVHFDSLRNKKGVDTFTVAHFDYGKGFATATAGLGVKSEASLVVAGTEGYIKVPPRWWFTKHFEVHFEDPNKIISYDEPLEGDALRYEIKAFVERAGGKAPADTGIDTQAISIAMAKVIGEFRK